MTSTTDGDFTQASDPLPLFDAWLKEAERSEPNDPNAMTVATADAGGMPNVRMVLLKSVDERGFVFYTNFESTKGRELLANPQAALLFHWKSLRRQVRVRGLVDQVSAEEADAYFASRPLGSRIGAWASKQSRPLESRAALGEAVKHFGKLFAGIEPKRPPYWSGFRVVPLEIEFWHDRQYRLHDRIVFRRENRDDGWTKTQLFP
ncbi:pyridoxamine 5'-phosphate oxidase [Rhodomicrobium sp. Az07]|uniref:pyridoxamine 5'-phosphate oxidase n=1 Tax=Rhodomicrobium sp. Az07 TaxID=2839034 RepID=UPI001BE9420A|nr:pyridoxamine 5'-phosphate oxidase [Rhodomicrobium sp. Az07]MBT3069375.1 pyridoxamine 5'-phosphate oxidase [Rhodomicrobium sp. Az07]